MNAAATFVQVTQRAESYRMHAAELSDGLTADREAMLTRVYSAEDPVVKAFAGCRQGLVGAMAGIGTVFYDDEASQRLVSDVSVALRGPVRVVLTAPADHADELEERSLSCAELLVTSVNRLSDESLESISADFRVFEVYRSSEVSSFEQLVAEWDRYLEALPEARFASQRAHELIREVREGRGDAPAEE